MAILFNFQTTSNHLHPLQVENCDSNSRLVVDDDDNGKFRLKRAKVLNYFRINHGDQRVFQFEIIVVLSDSFESLCYGSTAISNILFLTVRESTLDVRIRRPHT